MSIKYIVPIVAVLLLAAGCSKSVDKNAEKVATPPTAVSQSDSAKPDAMQDDMHAHADGHGSKLAGSRVDLQNSNSLKPGEVTLAFKLFGLDAHEFASGDLNIAHEKLMHLILVRDDATNFQHLHPEYVNGRWTVQTTVTEQGQYNMYVDIAPKEEQASILRVPVIIGSKAGQSVFPSITSNRTTLQDGISVSLNTNAFKTQEHSKLVFTLTQNGKAVSGIDPYLGAFGHVVVLRHGDADDYLHAHPVTETKPVDGKIEFESEFPAKGTYTIFAQFNIGGKVRTFPITLTVNEEGQAPADHAESATSDEHGH